MTVKNLAKSIQTKVNKTFMILMAAVLVSMSGGFYARNVFAGGSGGDPCADGIPNAYFSVSPATKAVGDSLSVTMDGSRSVACNDPIVDYRWDFGDGNTASGAVVNHQYGVGVFSPTLTITDESGLTNTHEYYYDIIVKADNQAPVFGNFTITAPQGEYTEVDASNYATDPDGDDLWGSFFLANQDNKFTGSSDKGYYYVQPSGLIQYNAHSASHGTDTFEVGVSDGFGGVTIVTVTVQIEPRLAGVNDTATTYKGTPVTIDVTENDFSYQDRPFSIAYVSWTYDGTVVNNNDGTITFTPNASFTGTTTFKYTISANHEGNYYYSEAIATVNVLPPLNEAPVAVSDRLTLDEDSSGSVNVLANDSDRDGDNLTASIVTGPQNGMANLAADGTLVYTPSANYNGSDNLVYKVTDGAGNSSTTTVYITVYSVNDVPVVVNDSADLNEDEFTNINVLANDNDVEQGNSMFVSIAKAPANGAVSVNPDRTIKYTPKANFYGTDSFTYRVTDTAGATATATVAVTVTSVNDAPTAQFSWTMNGGGQTQFDAGNSVDVDGQIVNYHWDFGDGTTASTTGSTTSHKYGRGSYQVALTVTDNSGAKVSYTATVSR